MKKQDGQVNPVIILGSIIVILAVVVGVSLGIYRTSHKDPTATLSTTQQGAPDIQLLDTSSNKVSPSSSNTKTMHNDPLEAGKSFLAENKTKPGVMTTSSGLQYKIITAGTGPKPTATQTVNVDYEGRLINGTVFDSSYKRGEPIEFPLNGVIAGWTEGLQLMPVGSKYELYIPSDLAYGARGAGGLIGPNETLIFTVELHSIK